MAAKKLNVHVLYASQPFICISSRSEFLSKVCEHYNLQEDEVEIWDLKNKKIIEVDDLQDFKKVEIRKHNNAMNGRRTSYPPPGPLSSKVPNRKELIQKLVDNRALSGKERAYIIELLESQDFSPVKRKNEDSDGPALKNRKIQVDTRSFGTRSYSTQTDEELINYKPPLNTTIATNELHLQSKRLAASEKIDMAAATDLMTKSFNFRRNFIFKDRPIVPFVKEKYPLLFSNAEVRNEIDRIFYDGKCKEFIENIEKYSEHILSIARDDDPLLLTTKKKMKELKTITQKQYAQDVGALLMLSPLVLDGRPYLKVIDMDSNPGDFPFITCQAKLHDLFFDNHIFKIFVERTMLCEASDFKEAILCLMASYFIFNIKYPDENFSTFVTFERLFLEANDTDENEIEDNIKQIIRSIQLKWNAKSCL